MSNTKAVLAIENGDWHIEEVPNVALPYTNMQRLDRKKIKDLFIPEARKAAGDLAICWTGGKETNKLAEEMLGYRVRGKAVLARIGKMRVDGRIVEVAMPLNLEDLKQMQDVINVMENTEKSLG
jgi:hypothetical protein